MGNQYDWLINDGVLKHFDLFMVWAEYPADTYEPILALLEHFELCFQLNGPVGNGLFVCLFVDFTLLLCVD
jgi:hypothetical protein